MSMSSTSILRVAARRTLPRSALIRPTLLSRSSLRCAPATTQRPSCFSTSSGLSTAAVDKAESGSSHSHEETFEEFTARFEKEFDGVQDVFELQRNLNNAFAYDLVPSPSVLTAALRAARRVNDFPTAVRIFEGIKAKVENKGQYDQYLEELKSLREELGVPLKEDLYPEEAK